MRVGIVTKQGSGIHSKEDLDGKIIGDFAKNNIIKNFNPAIKVLAIKNYTQAAKLLKAGRIDGFFTAQIIGEFIAERHNIELSEKIIDVFEPTDISLVISKKSKYYSDKKFLARIRKLIEQQRLSGAYDSLLDNYIKK